ncbi:hypothetical protein WR25_08053 [Diploscapter pachys]|uniref:Uncharacterized protein n=1 Tax=Diploscapter pachys TaxID=2018661 RepID=A0A2A2K0K9_9BILA|nr:hypothetical protein WR25_08053 [Diploscapter pachys]
MRHRLGEARMAGEIGVVEIDHAHRAAGGGVVDGAEMEVAKLVAREQREAPVPDRDDRKIVRHVIVRGDARARAHPDAGKRFARPQIDMVGGVQPVEILVHVDRGEIDGGRLRLSGEGGDARENLGQFRIERAEVHRHRGVIEQAPATARLADRDGEGTIAMMAQQIVARGVRRLQAGADQWPVARQPADDEGRVGRAQPRVERHVEREGFEQVVALERGEEGGGGAIALVERTQLTGDAIQIGGGLAQVVEQPRALSRGADPGGGEVDVDLPRSFVRGTAADQEGLDLHR